jgi:diadenylate cyclase
VIFQPELRRALERLGRVAPFTIGREEQRAAYLVAEISQAAEELSGRRHGAIIVLEGETGLQDHAETGVQVDGRVTGRLLLSMFYPGTALHDGAVIIRGNRVVAASCVLPLTERPLAGNLGTRHRAAVGITEQSDALAVVVSEETGIISIARRGSIARRLDEKRLRRVLEAFYLRPSLRESVRWR